MGERTLTKEEILRKISKAFRLGKDSKTPEGEALAAVTAVQKMLMRHGLSMADVDQYQMEKSAKEDARPEWKAVKQEILKPRQFISQYESYLQVAVKFLCNVEPLHIRTWDYKRRRRCVRLLFIGDEGDVAVAAAIYNELIKTARRLARLFCGKGKWTPSHRSFAEGFALKVQGRAKDMQAATEDFSSEDQQTYALVVRDKTNWLARKMQELFPRLEAKFQQARRGEMDFNAFHAGRVEGGKVHLGKNGIEGSEGGGATQLPS